METLFKIITLICSLGSFIGILYLIESHKTVHAKLDIVGELLFGIDKIIQRSAHARIVTEYSQKEEENDNG